MPRIALTFLLGVVSMATPLVLTAAPADSLAPAPRAIALPFDGGPRPTLTAHRAEGPIRVDGRLGEPFPWAVVGLDAVAYLADRAGLVHERTLRHDGRCVVELRKPSVP